MGNSLGTLNGNIAFDGIINNAGTTTWINTTHDDIDGETKNTADLQESTGFPSGFNILPWTYAAGMLPGLNGSAVPMLLHLLTSITSPFVGDGTSAEPYQIATPQQLAALATLVNAGTAQYSDANVYYKLTNHIDLSAYKSGEGWVPIGRYDRGATTNYFNGNFNGNGKTVTNLYINRPNSDFQGLFGVIDADGEVKNLGVVGCDIKGKDDVGGVAGVVSGILENCYATGSVSGNEDVGGVAGRVDGKVTNCYATGSVSGTDKVGGVVGFARNNATVTNCAALNPSVKGTGTDVGRVVGRSRSTSEVLSGNIAFDGIINNAGDTTWNNTGATQLDGESKTAADIQVSTGFPSGFNILPWTYEPGMLPGLNGSAVPMPLYLLTSTTSPFVGDGTSADPYQIATAEQLVALATLVNAGKNYDGEYFILNNNIDLSAYKTGEGWVPIGRYDLVASTPYYFNGNFNGKGFVVEGLFINRSADEQGLFGVVGSNGVVKNLGIMGCNITGNNRVGGVAGIVSAHSTVENCYATGTVSGKIQVGGVAGLVDGGTVENCYATGTVSGNDYVGGVAGWVYGGTVTNCYATGAVSGTEYVGGVAGGVFDDGTVENCAALNPSVKATGSDVGRVVGNSLGTLNGNVAFGGMINNAGNTTWTDIGASKLDGKDMNATQAVTATFWTTAANWSATAWDDMVWKFTNGELPILTGLDGQNGETGLYLSQKDAEVLTVEANPISYVYTGSPIVPIGLIIAKFGTTVLVIDEDYTISYVNNTNVGTATATVEFTGYYSGTKTVTFVIAKATPTGLITPTGAAIGYGQTLASSTLSGGTGAGTWAWADSTIVPTVINNGYDVIFTPNDTMNYTTVTETIGITVNLTATHAPTSVSATAGDGNASVNFTPPTNDGGSVITGYIVTTNDGKTATGTASPITVTGLTNGVSYTFTVIATNSVGDSPASAPSNTVTPMAVTVAVTGVSLDKSSITITAQGATEPLLATVLPSNATNSAVSWASSNSAVAAVDTNGLVTAVSAGDATITVTTADGGKTATCGVTVAAAAVSVTGVSVSSTVARITVGNTQQLTATVAPVTATNKGITWSSSNSAVAAVDTNGLVTAVSAGDATITVTTADGGKTATCGVTVSDTITPPIDPKPPIDPTPPTPSYGGRSSSSGGSSKADTRPVVGRFFTKSEATKLFNLALAAKPEGGATLSFIARNYTSADKSALVELAALAKKNGVTLTVHFDTVVNKAVTYRVSVNPANVTTSLDLAAKIVGGKMTMPKFSPAVEVAVKLPAGIMIENLKITQNGKDITATAKPWLDTNGYVHFTTTGGEIVLGK